MTIKTFNALCKALGDQSLPEKDRWKSIKYISIAGQASPGFDFQTMVKRNAIFFINNEGKSMFVLIDAANPDMGVMNLNDPVVSFIPLSVVDSVSFCITSVRPDGKTPTIEDLTESIINDGSDDSVELDNVAILNKENTFEASQTINGDLNINGNIVQNGESYETHAEKIYTKKNVIITREGAVTGLGENEYTGIQAEKYDGQKDGFLVFDRDGTARVGDAGEEQALLTREEEDQLSDGDIFVWDDENKRAKGLESESFSRKNAIITKSSTSLELKNNQDARYDTVTSLTLVLPQDIAADYVSSVAFTSNISDLTNFNYPLTIQMSGDDCTDKVFSPMIGNRYSVFFYYDGVNINGVVHSSEVV